MNILATSAFQHATAVASWAAILIVGVVIYRDLKGDGLIGFIKSVVGLAILLVLMALLSEANSWLEQVMNSQVQNALGG